MLYSNNTRILPGNSTSDRVTSIPTGGYGRVTSVSNDSATFLVCRTQRGRGGWGVHTEAGALLVSGWPTLARATAYAQRLLDQPAAGGAR